MIRLENPFAKKQKIEFINETPGVAQLMPMIRARDFRHAWVDRAVKEFGEIRKDPSWNHKKFLHTARCPGVFSLQRHGWIMRTWQDIVITTRAGDVDNFSWSCAHSQDGVGFHPPHQLANYWDSWPANTLRTVVKVNTGWRCVVPKGYYLLEMPLPLYEEARFTTVPGYFSREAGPAHMNVQLLWHVMDGDTLIKAGTPIAQYVLVPKEQMEMTCRDAAPSDGLQIAALQDSSKFVKNYADIRRFWGGE